MLLVTNIYVGYKLYSSYYISVLAGIIQFYFSAAQAWAVELRVDLPIWTDHR